MQKDVMLLQLQQHSEYCLASCGVSGWTREEHTLPNIPVVGGILDGLATLDHVHAAHILESAMARQSSSPPLVRHACAAAVATTQAA